MDCHAELEFMKICRTCLTRTNDPTRLTYLFGAALSSMLSEIADISVCLEDGLPPHICVQCVLNLSRAHTFKLCCERSDSHLRSLLVNQEQREENQLVDSADRSQCDVIESISQLESDEEDQELILSENPQIHPDPSSHDCNDMAFHSAVVLATCEDTSTNKDVVVEVDGCLFIEQYEEDPGHAHNGETVNNQLQLTIVTNAACGDTNIKPIEDPPIVDLEYPTEANQGTYVCDKCGMIYCDVDSLAKHNELVHCLSESVPLKCDVCGKVFVGGNQKMVRRHMKTHLPEKPHKCQTCGMTFAESSNLKKHCKRHTGELRNAKGKPYLCSHCGKSFKWSTSLAKHLNYHTRQNIYQCPLCTKFYVEQRALDGHLRTHTGERPFICPVCGRGFSQSSYVQIHLRTHTGEKPFACDRCDKRFSCNNMLKNHKRVHNFSCDLCPKTFSRQESAAAHRRTHTGEKPHTCGKCGRAFNTVSNLTSHLRSHSNAKTTECEVCKKRFATVSSLRVHLKNHHRSTVAVTTAT